MRCTTTENLLLTRVLCYGLRSCLAFLEGVARAQGGANDAELENLVLSSRLAYLLSACDGMRHEARHFQPMS